MNGERVAPALFLILALSLPLAALIARGRPRRQMVRLALIWVTIFIAAALIAAMIVKPKHHLALHNIYYQIAAAA